MEDIEEIQDSIQEALSKFINFIIRIDQEDLDELLNGKHFLTRACIGKLKLEEGAKPSVRESIEIELKVRRI